MESLRERVQMWDFARMCRFLDRHGVDFGNAKEVEQHWSQCRQRVLDTMDKLEAKVPETGTLDDAYMAKLLVVVYRGVLKTIQSEQARDAAKSESPKDSTEDVVAETIENKTDLWGPGDFIGDYEVLETLGEGAMGVVYLTQHLYLKKRFALKVLSPRFSQRPEFAQVFLNEARTLGNLKHPNLVEVFNFGVHKGAQYLVMEYVSGGTIEHLRRNSGGRLNAEETRAILESIASGLGHAHSYGIIHRDLKPDNLMLSEDGIVKISDFGLAYLCESDLNDTERLAQRLNSDTWTLIAEEQARVGVFTGGTQGYMAPEVALGEAGDSRADFYAVGAIAYYLLTGTIRHKNSPAPSTFIEGLDKSWDSFIETCMHDDPEQRYQDSATILSVLQTIDVSQPDPPTNSAWKKKRHYALSVILLCILLGILATLLWSPTLETASGFDNTSTSALDSNESLTDIASSNNIKNEMKTESTTVEKTTESEIVQTIPFLANPSFENDFEDWHLLMFNPIETRVIHDSNRAHDGNCFAKLSPNQEGVGWAKIQTRLQRLPPSGKAIRLTAWLRSEAGVPTNTAVMRLRGIQAYPYTVIGEYHQTGTFTDEWTPIILECVMPDSHLWPGVDYLELEISLAATTNDASTLHLDAIQLEVR